MKCLRKNPQHIYCTLLQTSSANRQIIYSSIDYEIRNWTKKSNQIQNLNVWLWLCPDYTVWEVNEMAAFDSPVAEALSPPQMLPLLAAFSSIAANLEGVKAFCFRQEKVVYLYPQFWQQNSVCCEVKPFPGATNLSLWVPCGYLITAPVLSHPCRMWCLVVTGEIFNGCLRHSSQLEQFSQKLLEKESDTSISLHWPTLDTPKHSHFPVSLSGKWWELPALRITLYLYCITAASCFLGGGRGRGGGSYGERSSSFLSAPEMLVWEILVFFLQLL